MSLKRLEQLAEEHPKYADFRRAVFAEFGCKSRKEGEAFDSAVQKREYIEKAFLFEPKLILFYHDLWHCSNTRIARHVIGIVCRMDDITKIQWDGRTWVKTDFNAPPGETHHIEGQETEADRKRVYGKSL